ncbi:MAG TPA: hypothetical protein VHG32_08715 [Thermoanaerobaculia bacterium]|nr:hypothetical protein [Thermoanaerobaculia bacterium]
MSPARPSREEAARTALVERHPTRARRGDSKPVRAQRPQARLIPTWARVARRLATAQQREAQVAAAPVAAAQRPLARRPTLGRAAVQRALPPRGAVRLPAARAAPRPRWERAVHPPARQVRRHPMRVPLLPEAAPAEREARRASPRSPAGQAWPPTMQADPSSVMLLGARPRLVRPAPAPAWTAAPTSRLCRPDAVASRSTAG